MTDIKVTVPNTNAAAELNPELVRLEIVKKILDKDNYSFSEVTEEQRLAIARCEALDYAFTTTGTDGKVTGGLPMTMCYLNSYIKYGRIVDRKVAAELVAVLRQRGGGNYKGPWTELEEEQQGIIAKLFAMVTGRNKNQSR